MEWSSNLASDIQFHTNSHSLSIGGMSTTTQFSPETTFGRDSFDLRRPYETISRFEDVTGYCGERTVDDYLNRLLSDLENMSLTGYGTCQGAFPETPKMPRNIQIDTSPTSEDTFQTSTVSLSSTVDSNSDQYKSERSIYSSDDSLVSADRLVPIAEMEKINKGAWTATHSGIVMGNVQQSEGVRSFLGIPYAKAPVGCRRWREAEMANSWPSNFMFDARKYGNQCVQLDTWESSYFRRTLVGLNAPVSEDCLNLNIYAPTKERLSRMKKRVPVMFFVHGGSFTTGGNSANIYDASNLVKNTDVIVVVPNYRMSIWGFLASKELRDDGIANGNYGLTDLLTALEWVKMNIPSIGGDETMITLTGHSAGAILVNYLLVALANERYQSQNLICRAILFSGAAGTVVERETDMPDTTVQPLFDALAKEAGCSRDGTDKLWCLRQTDTKVLEQIGIRNDWAYQWGPTIDGELIKGPIIDMMEKGEYAQVPILVTDCLDDGTIFTVSEKLDTDTDYRALLGKYFRSSDVPYITDAYPIDAYNLSYFKAASALFRDALFTCPLDDFAGVAARFSPKVYYFRFKTQLTVQYIISSIYLTADYGVFHGNELLYLFQGIPKLTALQPHDVYTVQRRIVSFMEGGLPDDPKYPTENKAVEITDTFQIDEICKKWYTWPRSSEPFEMPGGKIPELIHLQKALASEL